MPAEQVIALGFLLIILLGTGLLMLPISTNEGVVTPFIDALLTAVSSTCVTGLIVVDTGIHWSLFGQCVILTMIQVGGLGFMSFALLLTGVIGRRVSPRVRNLTAQSLGLDSVENMGRFISRMFIGTAVMEGIGALLLMIRTIPMLGVGRGIFTGIFLSISAFCNAGFDPLGGLATPAFSSLVSLETDPLLLLTLGTLIVLGASGFLVWNDIWERLRRGRRLSVYTRFVLILIGAAILGGMLLFCIFEWNNPATIGDMSVCDKLVQCLFQSITPRTAGFDAIGQTELTECSKALTMLLMLVGGASGSTAGGIKLGTVGVVLLAVWATLTGRRDVTVMRRRIGEGTVRRALCIMSFMLISVLVFGMLIASAEGITMTEALYECCSAFCTVGLSLSLTPTLTVLSKALLCIAMYTGRVGALTLSYILLRARDKDVLAYPETSLMIG